jgi:hypothetical protein
MERVELFLETNSVSPTLFIGLGGSGSKIVDRVSDKLRRQWNWEQYRQLVHFFAIDTNIADLESLPNIPPAHRLLISDFDKREFVKQKRGQAHLPPDPFCTQWLPEGYDFRATRGSGAGQVRIESRLSLFYQLERDRGELIKRLNEAIYLAKDHENPFRRFSPRKFNVFIFGSVAGGTGSGGFLAMAYLLQELVENAGWIPQLYATLLMPSLFHRAVKGALQPDIDANGYAALKELEHLMRLGYESTEPRLRFHVNPMHVEKTHVDRMPFLFCYLVDLPAQMSIAPYREAIADAVYLQLFSPIIGTQHGVYDNYEKHQKSLAHGYAVNYGTYGCSMLVLPDNDLLEYCAMRYAKKALESYLTFQLPDRAGELANEFAINYDDPRFRAMTEERRARVIDEKFRDFVRYCGRLEQDSDNTEGPFSTIVHRCERRDKQSQSLPAEFDREMEKLLQAARDAIDLPMMTPVDLTPTNIKVDAEVDELREAIARARAALRTMAEGHKVQIGGGSFLRDFFERNRVDPFCQRYFLIGLAEHLATRLGQLDAKHDELKRYALDSDSIRNEIKSKKETLARTAEWTLLERLKRRNRDFEESRADFVRFFNDDLQGAARLALETELARELFGALKAAVGGLLDTYRNVTARAAEMIGELGRSCDRMLASAESASGRSEAGEYVLDVEVLRDFTGRRHWHHYFEERIGSGEQELAMFDRDRILATMNDAFGPRIDARGQRRTPTTAEVAESLREAFTAMGRERLAPMITGTRAAGPDRKLKGLLVDDALRLEARYYLTEQLRKDRSSADPTPAMIDDYVERKLQFCASKAAVLATLDESLASDDAVVSANDIFLVGMHEHFLGAEQGSLQPLLNKAAPGHQLLEGWYDEKRVVFYRAVLGVPLYFFRRVNGELRNAYLQVMARKERGYPLHIDGDWETSLPNLDPLERKQEQVAAERGASLRDYSWAVLAGVVVEHDGRCRWTLAGHEGELGTGRRASFQGFVALDARTAQRLREAAQAQQEAARADRALAGELRARIEKWVADLDEEAWRLEQRGQRDDRETVAFLGELQQVLRGELERLGPAART